MAIESKNNHQDSFRSRLELNIQKRAERKDRDFVLSGKWKKFIRGQENFKVYAVDGEWVRNNLSVIFGHGGHGFVHEFIPNDEIWVGTHHFEGCGCSNVGEDRQISQEYFDSTVIHEIAEFKEMKKGKTFQEAHQIALVKEREAEILKDPYTETNSG